MPSSARRGGSLEAGLDPKLSSIVTAREAGGQSLDGRCGRSARFPPGDHTKSRYQMVVHSGAQELFLEDGHIGAGEQESVVPVVDTGDARDPVLPPTPRTRHSDVR